MQPHLGGSSGPAGELLISICNPLVVVSMIVMVVVVVLVVLVILLCWSDRAGLGKNSFIRLVTGLESLRGVNQTVEFYVSEPLGFFGCSVLDNVHILHSPECLKIRLQLVLVDIFANNNKEPKKSFFFIGLSTTALIFGMGDHYLRSKSSNTYPLKLLLNLEWSGVIANTLPVHLLNSQGGL